MGNTEKYRNDFKILILQILNALVDLIKQTRKLFVTVLSYF